MSRATSFTHVLLWLISITFSTRAGANRVKRACDMQERDYGNSSHSMTSPGHRHSGTLTTRQNWPQVAPRRVYCVAAGAVHYVQRLLAVHLIWRKVRGSALNARLVQLIAGKSDVQRGHLQLAPTHMHTSEGHVQHCDASLLALNSCHRTAADS